MTEVPIQTPQNPWPGQIRDALALNDGVVTQRPGSRIQISASVTATAVTLTLYSGNTIVVNPAVGDNIYPYEVIKAVVTSGTVTGMYNLFS